MTDVPNPPHGDTVDATREQFSSYRASHPGVIHRMYAGSECKLLMEQTQSERHPDLAIYKTPAPGIDSSVWSVWVPEIVIEVVSQGSAHRDYVEKPEDYLIFGVLEYWIIDAIAGKVTINRRVRGRWQQRENPQHDPEHILRDFKTGRHVVLAKRFYYFGAKAKPIGADNISLNGSATAWDALTY